MTFTRYAALIAFALIPLAAASASGDRETHGPGGGPDGGPGAGPGGPGGPPEMTIPDDAAEYTGTYGLVGGMTPALLLDDGTVFYLVLEFPFTKEILPEEGTVMTVIAVPEDDHPDRLDVYGAEVDGVRLEPAMPGGGGPGEGGGPPGKPRS